MSKIISTNPSSNYEVIGEIEVSTEQDVKDSVAKARAAQPAWAALSLTDRSKAITSFMEVSRQRYEDIAVAMSKEMGKPITATRAQVTETIDYFQDYIDMAEVALAPEVVFQNETEKHTAYREPRGVIACITPWNFPFLNVPWQAGQALVAGNTIVYKPSEEIIVFAKLIAELVAASDLPDGVFTVLYGDSKVGEQLVQQPVDAIHFTGSSRTGQRITEIAAKTSTPVLTEMGGSAPGIIFEDAEIDKIIDTVYDQRFDNTGQYCDGLKRLIVHESKLDEVLAGLKQANTTRKVGNALDDDTNIGPLVAKRQLDLLETQVKDAVDKGAKIIFGGKRPDNLEGAYYLPTVLTDITFDMRIWKEEVFGPVLPVVTFKTEDEAIGLANDTIYGLGAFVFTSDKERYHRIVPQLQSGMVALNNALYYGSASPFGGYKKSGNSRTGGIVGFHEVMQVKLVSEEK